ncbi:MAG TPA: ATP-binding protein [Coleofasciculaceae cyanobacterium]
MVKHLFVPQSLIGRSIEMQQISQILAKDGDFLLVSAPGNGRRTLIQATAQQLGVRVIEIDCLRTTSANRFLQLLADGITAIFTLPTELALIERWSHDQPVVLEQIPFQHPRLVWHPAANSEWAVFEALLALPQRMAEWLDCRVLIVFLNFPHIRSWDRSGQWEDYLRQEIQRQSRVSYALVATVAEPWMQDSNLQSITLPPLEDQDIQDWLIPTLAAEGLRFDPNQSALELFLSYVQGHLGDAIALARRIWLDRYAFVGLKETGAAEHSTSDLLIQAHHVHRSILALVEDLAPTFESLILLLPPSQVRVLESLALDPTDKPHARDYIQKHQLSRGGGLQGALSSLEQKGLVYGAKYGYRIVMPFLAFWLKQRLS